MQHYNMYIQASTVKRKGKDGCNRKLVESYRDPETGKPRNRTVRTLETLPLLERARLIYRHGGSNHLDAEEWLALQQAGDGSAVLAGYLRQTGLEAILRKQLGRVTGNLIGDMISLQVGRPASKNARSTSHRQTLGYLLGGKNDVSAERFYRAQDELADGFDGVREAMNSAHQPRAGRVLLYDLSNSYFCGH